jgi:hypothetical protein
MSRALQICDSQHFAAAAAAAAVHSWQAEEQEGDQEEGTGEGVILGVASKAAPAVHFIRMSSGCYKARLYQVIYSTCMPALRLLHSAEPTHTALPV